ncbi:NAD(P)H-binding protein [Chryseobacterium joostei]|uniref:NAD(P)H-binding protein n=1 Tax=Chryseobacterium joostei TaxID=112234 RepID=UPI003D0FD1A2
MNMLIFGFSREFETLLTNELILQTPYNITLSTNIPKMESKMVCNDRLNILEGMLNDRVVITKAVNGAGIICICNTYDDCLTKEVVQILKESDVKRVVAVSIIETDSSTNVKRDVLESKTIKSHKEFADIIRRSGKDYTIVCLSRHNNKDGGNNYLLTHEKMPFSGIQITVEGIVEFLVSIASMIPERESFIEKYSSK